MIHYTEIKSLFDLQKDYQRFYIALNHISGRLTYKTLII